MKTRMSTALASLVAVVAVLAMAPAGTSAPPADNAVVHWSGVAANAIVVGRAPAASSVLGGMVHGAMYDAVASIKGGMKPFATGVTAPPGASADMSALSVLFTSIDSMLFIETDSNSNCRLSAPRLPLLPLAWVLPSSVT